MNDRKSLKERIHQLIAQNEMEDAFRLLSNNQFTKLDKELILLNNRFNKAQEERRMGVISKDEADLEQNKIKLALVELAAKVEKGPPTISSIAKENNSIRYVIISVAVLALAAAAYFWYASTTTVPTDTTPNNASGPTIGPAPAPDNKVQEVFWQLALKKNELEKYQEYLLLFPKGKYVEAAHDSILKVEDKYWKQAVAENQPQGFWNYLDIFPNGKHKKQAREQINKIGDDKYWTQTIQANMVEVYEKYLEEFPNGHHRAKAQEKIDSIQKKQAQINQDNLDFEAATKAHTIDAFKQYVATHPTGQHLEIAQTNIKALEAKKVCGCPPKTFKTMSHHTFAKFNLPKGNGGAVVKIPGGVYNKYVFPKCNRVWWTNLMFMCDPTACVWKRVSGNWDADALCHGSTPKHKYLTVGSF